MSVVGGEREETEKKRVKSSNTNKSGGRQKSRVAPEACSKRTIKQASRSSSNNTNPKQKRTNDETEQHENKTNATIQKNTNKDNKKKKRDNRARTRSSKRRKRMSFVHERKEMGRVCDFAEGGELKQRKPTRAKGNFARCLCVASASLLCVSNELPSHLSHCPPASAGHRSVRTSG